ncbi:MAG: hypothetical protein OHK0046_08150 [Anaerolineae bacterium]
MRKVLFLVGLFLMISSMAAGQGATDYIVFPSPLLPLEPLPENPESTGSNPSPYGVEGWDGACAEAALWFGFGFVPTADDDTELDYRAVVLYDGNGNALSALWRRRAAFEGAPPYDGDGLFGLRGITAIPVTLRMYDIPPFVGGSNIVSWVGSYGREVASLTFDPSQYIPDCSKLPTVDVLQSLEDRRIGDLGASGAVYAVDGTIVVYGINDNSDGYTTVTLDTTALENNTAVEENTLLASSEDGKYAIYRLTTGQFQVNIGPNANGEVRVLIFNDLSGEVVQQYNFNVYDILSGE